jgi:hypothetical protein
MLQDDPPAVLLIDGLDECEGHNIQREILRLVGSTANNQCFRLRILVASRQEPHIQETFEEESFRGCFDSINIEQSFDDVRTYLSDEFSRIHRQHPKTMGKIRTPWPAPDILDMLVRNSSGYFVYASTVIKFVDDEYSRPSRQLDVIIQGLVPHGADSPFATLDKLYMQILSRVPAKSRSSLCDIFSVTIHYSTNISLEDIDELLGLEPGDVSLILRPLHSVLKLPSGEGEIEVHHASFRDFLQNQQRSSTFYVGSPQHREKLGHCMLKALAYMHNDPQKNRSASGLTWYVHMQPQYHFLILEFIGSSPCGDHIGLNLSLPLHLLRMLCPLFSRSTHISSSFVMLRVTQ